MKTHLLKPLLLLVLLWGPIPLIAQDNTRPSDKQIDVPVPYDYKALQEYNGIKETSFYLTMRDGVKLAVNLYLPKGLKEGEKIPTILYQTRYWRSVGFRWPLNGMIEMIPSSPNFNMKEFVKSGYALVSVDVRGTGASFGSKDLTLPTYNEMQDGGEIVDWIIQQPWSDGQVGATGISYIGITALYLTLNHHPAVKAIAPMYSVFDLYDDIGMPGGVFMEDFLSKYAGFCGKLDQNELGRGFLTNLLVKGVEPVKGQRKLYRQAFAEHSCNYYQKDENGSAEFIDDIHTPDGLEIRYILSPHQHLDEFNKANLPTYSYSGWWDLAFTHAAVKQYLNFTNPNNKLILGPWSHGGPINIDPYNPSPTQFDHVGEVIKFFDYHLKGIDNGINKEAPVHYFTMGENKWKSSNTWPPSNTHFKPFYFSGSNSLDWSKPIQASVDTFITDETVETGRYSRWNLSKKHYQRMVTLTGKRRMIREFATSSPLSEDIEVTGHPVISLYMSSSVNDVAVFAYLEDIDENGKVYRVTEGLLRVVHRKVFAEAPHYKDAVPYHSFKKEDAVPLEEGVANEVVFDFYPTSYQFKKGHKIRVSICGNDANYFKQLTPDKTEWRIYTGPEYPSHLQLPIMGSISDNIQGKQISFIAEYREDPYKVLRNPPACGRYPSCNGPGAQLKKA